MVKDSYRTLITNFASTPQITVVDSFNDLEMAVDHLLYEIESDFRAIMLIHDYDNADDYFALGSFEIEDYVDDELERYASGESNYKSGTYDSHNTIYRPLNVSEELRKKGTVVISLTSSEVVELVNRALPPPLYKDLFEMGKKYQLVILD